MAPKLGILAGDGELPRKLVEVCQATGRDVFVVAFENESNPDLVINTPHVWINMGAVGYVIRALKEAECRDVVLAGPVKRPKFSSLGLDKRGAMMLPKLLRARGDNALLSIIISELESEGFNVVGADDVLSDILAGKGLLGSHEPNEDEWGDIWRGVEVVNAIGAIDIGQAAVIHQGYVLGVEAAEGTDALIDRAAVLRREESGGVLVKLRKPNQDRRADLPAIGINTIEHGISAGLAGIAIEAYETLVLGRDLVVESADSADFFLVGVNV